MQFDARLTIKKDYLHKKKRALAPFLAPFHDGGRIYRYRLA